MLNDTPTLLALNLRFGGNNENMRSVGRNPEPFVASQSYYPGDIVTHAKNLLPFAFRPAEVTIGKKVANEFLLSFHTKGAEAVALFPTAQTEGSRELAHIETEHVVRTGHSSRVKGFNVCNQFRLFSCYS